MSQLFSPLSLRTITFRNRIFVSPMCQYSSEDGLPTDWHFVHLGSRAVGGAGLVMVEASAVTPEGRISPADSGLWSDTHAHAFGRITAFIRAQGAAAGIQLAHAGRKGSTKVPWEGEGAVGEGQGGWTPSAPSAIPFAPGYPEPAEMTEAQIESVAQKFAEAADRAAAAGFQVVELHMAHGYLLHEFLSPLSNRRTDRFGGSLENRMRFPLLVAEKVRRAWPSGLPLFARLSVSDWAEGGWDLGQSVALCHALKAVGVDLVDASSGGLVHDARIPAGPGYQVPFAAAIRKETDMPTAAVGLITEPAQAEQIIANQQADAVMMAREFLRDPYWPQRAAKALGAEAPWPKQYERGRVK